PILDESKKLAIPTKQAHQLHLTLHQPNKKRRIPESNQNDAMQKFAELIVHYFKIHGLGTENLQSRDE
ncbi:MAG: hypothetical protein HRT70_09855, partial [Flavobacteriaceae bacterium]|nr:hypothetical protein [Flavobacteriaceae bacterium]